MFPPETEYYSDHCSQDYSNLSENLKYAVQFFYLFLTLCLLIYLLVVLHVKNRRCYQYNLCYWIFTMDCVMTIILILLDLFVVRLFLYVPQLCPVFSKIFIENPMINDIVFPLYNYCRVFKTGGQSALILVKLLSVQPTVSYDSITKRKLPVVLLLLVILPLLVIWNTIISEKDVVFWYGGFFTIYHRRVEWVSLSFLHLICLLSAILVILITSIVIYYKVADIPMSTSTIIQRSLIINSSYVACGFMLQAAFQSYYAFFRYKWWFPTVIIDMQFVIYDVLTVGCPILMLLFANDFRSQTMFGPRSKPSQQSYEFKKMSLKSEKDSEKGIQRRNTNNTPIVFTSIPE